MIAPMSHQCQMFCLNYCFTFPNIAKLHFILINNAYGKSVCKSRFQLPYDFCTTMLVIDARTQQIFYKAGIDIAFRHYIQQLVLFHTYSSKLRNISTPLSYTS